MEISGYFFIKLPNKGRKKIVTHHCAGGYRELSRQKVIQITKDVFDFTKNPKELLSITKQDFSFSGQSYLTFTSIEKRIAECMFDPLNLLRDRWLRHIKRLCRFSKTA